MIIQAFEWWSEGLAVALAGMAGWMGRPRRFELVSDARPLVLRPAGDGGRQEVIRLPDAPAQAPPAEVLRRTRGSRIAILVPPPAILERRLDLPGESRPYVENIVRHQIDALFPWHAADVVHAAVTRDRADGRLEVIVWATARSPIAPALAAASACGAGEVVVSGRFDGGEGIDDAVIPVAGPADGGALRRSRTIARCAVIVLALCAVCLPACAAYIRSSLAADIALLDQAIADRRAVMKRAAEARGRADGNALETRKQRSVVAAAALDALSAVLPDDTYLTDLSLDAGRLRMTGRSGRATELVPLLEGSGRFSSASFHAPVTRVPGEPGDRFSIEAVVVPHAEKKP